MSSILTVVQTASTTTRSEKEPQARIAVIQPEKSRMVILSK